MKSTRINMFMMMLFFGAFGIMGEVFFTAFYALFSGQTIADKPPLALAGYTYVWMIFVYMLIPILFRYILPYVIKFSTLIRLLIYVLTIYIVEFVSGFLLEQITGNCPWEYTSGLHIMGYVQLYYFPAWLFFAFLIERMYLYLSQKV